MNALFSRIVVGLALGSVCIFSYAAGSFERAQIPQVHPDCLASNGKARSCTSGVLAPPVLPKIGVAVQKAKPYEPIPCGPVKAGCRALEKAAHCGPVSTLQEALEAAYVCNPDLESMRYQVNAKVEVICQVNSGWRPGVDIHAMFRPTFSDFRERNNNPYDRQIGVNPMTGEPIYTRYNSRTNRAYTVDRASSGELRVQQNVFNGFGTLAASDKAYSDFVAACWGLRAAEQNVLYNVVNAYLNVIVAEQVLLVLHKNEEYFKELLTQTKAQKVAGVKTEADVASAEGKLADATSQVISKDADVQNARAVLVSLIGKDLSDKLQVPDPYKALPEDLKRLQRIAQRDNPDLLSVRYGGEVARFGVAVVGSQFLPTVDFSGSFKKSNNFNYLRQANYAKGSSNRNYRDYEIGPSSQTSVSDTQDVTTTFSATVPLYKGGGITYTQFRQARLDVKTARLSIEKQQREVVAGCISYFYALLAARQNIVSAKVALASNKVALDAYREQYKWGERNFIETMKMQEEWYKSAEGYIKVLQSLVNASYGVLKMAGKLNAAQLGLRVKIYSPVDYYDEYHAAFVGLGKDESKTPLFESVPVPANAGYHTASEPSDPCRGVMDKRGPPSKDVVKGGQISQKSREMTPKPEKGAKQKGIGSVPVGGFSKGKGILGGAQEAQGVQPSRSAPGPTSWRMPQSEEKKTYCYCVRRGACS